MRFTKMCIEEFGDYLEFLKWEQGVDDFRITELDLHTSYEVHGLTLEIENDCCVLLDRDNILIQRLSCLMIFLKSSVLSIKRIYSNNNVCVEINLDNYIIDIEPCF